MSKNESLRHVKVPLTARLLRFGFQFGGAVFPTFFGKLAYRYFSHPRKRAKHKYNDDVLDSAQVADFQFNTLNIKYYRWGNPDHPLIVLIHGWESRGTALRGFVKPFLEQGYQVATFDAPAHGDSEGEAVNMPIYANCIGAFFQKVGVPHGIIAHSFGGNSTMYYLSRISPETTLNRIVLVAAPSNIYKVLDDVAVLMHLAEAAKNKFFAKIETLINMPLKDCQVDKLSKQAKIGRLMLVHDDADKIVPFADSLAYHAAHSTSVLLNAKDMGHFNLMKKQEIKSEIVNFITSGYSPEHRSGLSGL